MAHFDMTLATRARTLASLSVFGRLGSMMALKRQRRDLANLSDEALVDIGLTREEAVKEAERPVWDAPLHFFR